MKDRKRKNICLNKRSIYLVLLMIPAWVSAREVRIETNPVDCHIEIVKNESTPRISGGYIYKSPADIDFRPWREPYIIRVSREGYESREILYEYYKNKSRELSVDLLPLSFRSAIRIDSLPEQAAVSLDGVEVGKTPLTESFTFSRPTSQEAWGEIPVVISAPKFFKEELKLARDLDRYSVELLAKERLVRVSVTSISSKNSREISVPLTVNGELVGETPYTVEFIYGRETKASDWKSQLVELGMKDQYQPKTVVLPIEKALGGLLEVTLDPVTEILTKRNMPMVDKRGNVPSPGFDGSTSVAILNTTDDSSPATDLRQITDYTHSSRLESVNSYCITSDGQQVIFGVTRTGSQGNLYSNLIVKSSSGQSNASTQLTQGEQYVDFAPAASSKIGDEIVVFQSNRGVWGSYDISSFRLVGSRIVGGIQQLTRDNRLNVSPAFLNSRESVYFSSYEPRPVGEPLINHVQINGAALTNLNEIGTDISMGVDSLLYFSNRSPVTGFLQIFSMTMDGLRYSTVLNDPQLSNASCRHPSLSPDGSLLLFASDASRDSFGRMNMNLFLYNKSTGFVQQLTDNGSEDVSPKWSPTEPNVVFFLSNRGGAYNIWRMNLPGI